MKQWLAVALLGGTAAFSAHSAASTRPDTTDYRALLLSDAPLLDVRSPVEFAKGSFPSARNVPLLTNDERYQVGICYKQLGQDAAIELGNALVGGQVKDDRMQQWTEFCRANPDGYLYCHRGGLRSNTVQDWIFEATGVRYPLVTGGFKAMRRFLLDELEHSLDACNLVVVCGKTGTGKTRVIQQLCDSSVDLEGLAHHRGSTFGRLPEDPTQPSQIGFENGVSIAFLKALEDQDTSLSIAARQRVFVEDEGGRIGNLRLPDILRNRMKACDGIVIIEEDLEDRLDVLVEDYVHDLRRRFLALYGDEIGPELHQNYLLDGLHRIRNKLGGDRYAELTRTVAAAFQEEEATGDYSLHRLWIAALLTQHYDRMYDHQLDERMLQDEVLFRGNREAIGKNDVLAISHEQ